jgi:hypothetical protein
MTIKELVVSIQSFSDEMREITLAAGVPEATFEKILEVDSDLTEEDLENRHAFLTRVRAEEYRGVLEIWRLLLPDIWKRYEEFGIQQLREQKLLRAARKNLRKVWRKRYGEAKPVPKQGVNQGLVAGEPV